MDREIAPLTIRERIDMLEAKCKELSQVPIPVKHFFFDGVYARQILIPKGTFVTGIIHKTDSFDIVSTGEMSVINDRGEIKRVKAPCILFSPPGVKKAGVALEDTLWTSLFPNPTNEHDIGVLEKNIAECSEDDLERFRIERDRDKEVLACR